MNKNKWKIAGIDEVICKKNVNKLGVWVAQRFSIQLNKKAPEMTGQVDMTGPGRNPGKSQTTTDIFEK